MVEAVEIVERAYRKIGVIGVGAPASKEMLDEGIDALNMMIAGWKLRNVDLSVTTLVSTDPIPLGDEYTEGLVFTLAGRLSENYLAPPSFDPDDWFRTLQSHHFRPGTQKNDAAFIGFRRVR